MRIVSSVWAIMWSGRLACQIWRHVKFFPDHPWISNIATTADNRRVQHFTAANWYDSKSDAWHAQTDNSLCRKKRWTCWRALPVVFMHLFVIVFKMNACKYCKWKEHFLLNRIFAHALRVQELLVELVYVLGTKSRSVLCITHGNTP